MKKAFTLIEMIGVILLMGVLTLMGMQFSGDQIGRLQLKNEKETLLSAYQALYSKNLVSSYFEGEKYTTLKLHFTTEAQDNSSGVIEIWYLTGDNTISEDIPPHLSISTPLSFNRLVLDNHPLSEAYLFLTPYHLSCDITAEGGINRSSTEDKKSILKIQSNIDDFSSYCFEIASKTCRMREVSCISVTKQ